MFISGRKKREEECKDTANHLLSLINKIYLPLRITVLLSSPAEFLATHRNSPQSVSVMFFSVNTAADIPLVNNLFPLYHVTLTGEKLLAVQ